MATEWAGNEDWANKRERCQTIEVLVFRGETIRTSVDEDFFEIRNTRDLLSGDIER